MILVYYHGLVSKLRTLFYSISLFALKKDKLINNKKYTAYAICCRRPSVWFFPGILKNGKREAGDIFFGIPGSRKSRFKYKSIIIFIIVRRLTNTILRETVKFYVSFCFGHKTNQFLTENEFEIEIFHHFSEKKVSFSHRKTLKTGGGISGFRYGKREVQIVRDPGIIPGRDPAGPNTSLTMDCGFLKRCYFGLNF